MDADALRDWFDQYLDAFAGCARHDRPLSSLLGYYALPLTVTTDEAVITVTGDAELAAVVEGQVDGLHARGYAGTQILGFDAVVCNATSALLRTSLARRDVHGTELDNVAMTYLVTTGSNAPAISAMLVHGAG